VDAIVVSNHGGRTLDLAVPTAVSLVEVARELRNADGAPEIIVDGGIRRGRDVLIALALGARAVLVGRPILWGLAAGGADGVRDVLALLERQLRTEMSLIGCRSVAELTADVLSRRPANATSRSDHECP
jgi:4-hydroxymandelate oxidase